MCGLQSSSLKATRVGRVERADVAADDEKLDAPLRTSM
jgi:hypothetical protein